MMNPGWQAGRPASEHAERTARVESKDPPTQALTLASLLAF